MDTLPARHLSPMDRGWPWPGTVRQNVVSGSSMSVTRREKLLYPSAAPMYQDHQLVQGWRVDLCGRRQRIGLFRGATSFVGETMTEAKIVRTAVRTELWRLSQPYRPTKSAVSPSRPTAGLPSIRCSLRGRTSGSLTTSTCNSPPADRKSFRAHLLASFNMSDGATLTLKTAHNADRLKRPYAGPIAPDEILAAPGEVVGRAVSWLQNER